MDVGRAFGFVFRDDRWFGKLAVGSLMTIIPIFGGLALYGYLLRITRQVAAGVDVPLPEWNEWGELLTDGLKLFGATIIWTLPLIVLQIPLQAAALSSPNEMTNPGLTLAGSCLVILLSLAYVVILPVVTARLATTRSFAAAFDIGAVFRAAGSNLGDYLIILLVGLAIGIVFGIVFACVFVVIGLGAAAATDNLLQMILLIYGIAFVAAIVVGPYLGAVFYHLYGQAYYRAMGGPVAVEDGPRQG